MDTDKKSEDNVEKKEDSPANSEGNATDTGSLTKPGNEGSDEKADAKGTPSDKDAKDSADEVPAKKPNSLKQTFKRFWLYLVIVMLVAVIGAVFAVVSSLQKKKTPPPPSVQSQSLSQNQLKQLKGTGIATNGQTLTIQGDSVLDGQDLVRGNLYVAGNIQSGGSLSIPALTISNTGNFSSAQASELQVANTSVFQGVVTVQNGLNLSGNTAISSATVGTLTATKLILTGNGDIAAQSHLTFTGAFPHRTLSFGVLGNGGQASVNGSDTNGTVSLNTGSGPRSGCFITIIFLIPFTGPANILLGPIGLGSAGSQSGDGLHAYAQPVTDPTTGNTTGFKICTASTPLPNQAFGFSYLADGAPN